MNWTLALSAVLAPVAAYVMWVVIARPLAERLTWLIPDGWLKQALTKKRDGYL